MMGMYTNTRTMGFAPVIAAAAAASGPAAPIIIAVAAGIGLILKFVHFGPDPRKRPDTVVVEAAEQGFNRVWYAVSGEDLGGALRDDIQPGDFGKMGVSLTNGGAPSAYDAGQYATPYGPTGNPNVDIDAAIQSAQNTLGEAISMLQRSESVANIQAAFAPLMARLNEVKRQRQLAVAQPGSVESAVASLFGGGGSSWLPWAAAGVVGYLAFS